MVRFLEKVQKFSDQNFFLGLNFLAMILAIQKCPICKEDMDAAKDRTLKTDKGVETLLERCKLQQLDYSFKKGDVVHVQCAKTLTRSTKLVFKPKVKESKPCTGFVYKCDCLFCSKTITEIIINDQVKYIR